MRRLLALGLLLLTAAGDAPAVQRVADALAAGSTARGAKDRAAASATLAALGAVPGQGQEDLAATWRGRAVRAPYRERVLGPVYRGLTLAPGAVMTFEQAFYAGKTARVAVVAPDRVPVALRVFDDEGRPRCDGARTTCEWVPAWTARARVEIQNKSDRDGHFFVVMQ